jgi:nucleoside-diphosphate-sugar epimerase
LPDTINPFRRLGPVKVCLAGATGVLGRALVPKLLAAGHSARLLVRDPAKAAQLFSGLDVEIVECDLLTPGMEAQLAPMMEGCEAVIHAATSIPPNFTAPGALTANTHLRIRGTGRLQRAALEVGVTTFIQQSIIMAYRDGGDDWLDENTWIDQSPERREVCHPVAIMESMMRLYARQPKPMRWTILKGGLFVGPDTFQPDVVEKIRRQELIVPGGGSHFVSLVHVDDYADAFIAALDSAPAASIFNICAEPIRYGEYVDGIADLIHAPHPQRDPSQPRPASHRASTKAAREMLGWEPKHNVWPDVRVTAAP